ncbi:MAG: choice-of-anchor J domain-containing protein [Bacteroidales bacterium]
MFKFIKLTFIGILLSSLAFGQQATISKFPAQTKKIKKTNALQQASDFQQTITKAKKPQKPFSTKATIIYSEDFSSGSMPTDFTLYNEDGLTPAANVSYVNQAWVVNPNLLDSSDYTALSTSWYDPAGQADDWMVLPKITIPAGALINWNAIAYDGSYPDGYEILVSTTDSAVSSFTSTIASINAENDVWTSRTASLNAFAGQDVFIAFRNNSNDQFLLAIDDITLVQPDPYNIGVTAITEPSNNNGCSLSASEDVTIDIENTGSDSITNGFDVYYSINGNTPVNETISDTLLPGATMTYTFNTTADLSTYQNYDIIAYTAYPQDTTHANDTASTTVISADGMVTIEVTTDGYPSETSWELLDQNNQIVAVSPVYEAADSTYTSNICLSASDCYTFNIYDSYGDGIFSPGGYAVYFNAALVDSSYSFAGSQASVFNIGNGCAANDLAVTNLYALGKAPEGAGSPQSITAIIHNKGTANQTNAEVTLDITGDNTHQDTLTIASINSLDSATVTFNSFSPASTGVSNINVSVASDDNNNNNSMDYRQEVTTNTYNHADTAAINIGIGFNTSEGIMVAKYHVNGEKSVKAARINVAGSAAGNQLYGVIVDSSGNILSSGQPITITAADTNTYVELPISPYNVKDQHIYVGFAQIANPNAGYFPLNTQIEEPGRSNAFYVASGLNGNPLTMNRDFGKWMIEGVIMDPISSDAINLGITDINSACNLSNKDVEIGIFNNGTDTIFNLTASYSVNNGSPITDTINDTIQPGDTLMHNFSTPIDASAYNMYEVEAWVDLNADTISSNDTANTVFYNIEPADIPYTTSFEANDDPYAWTFIDGNNDGISPVIMEISGAPDGNQIIYVQGGSDKQDEYVVSRCLNLEAGKDYELSYWHTAGSFWGMPIPENVEIVIGTSPDPASLTTLVADLGQIDVIDFTKMSHLFQVNSTDVYHIAFHITTDSPYYYLIDEFSISDVTSVEENMVNSMRLYPNPTNHIINIESEDTKIQQIQIFNTMGQQVAHKAVNAAHFRLNVQNYDAGIYFIRMLTEQGMVTKKFQVNP